MHNLQLPPKYSENTPHCSLCGHPFAHLRGTDGGQPPYLDPALDPGMIVCCHDCGGFSTFYGPKQGDFRPTKPGELAQLTQKQQMTALNVSLQITERLIG